MLRSALFLLLFMFSMLVISCDPTEIVEPDLINFGFTEDYTNTLQIQAHTAYVSLPYGSTLTSLQINGDVLWGPDFVINGDHSVIYQFDTIYSTHNGMGVYRDTTSYVLTLGDAVYSGTLIKPDYPQLQLLALDMQEDYHFTWSTQKSPDNFLLNVGFFGGSPELNVQLSGKKRGFHIHKEHWANQTWTIFRINLDAYAYVCHSNDLLAFTYVRNSQTVTTPE